MSDYIRGVLPKDNEGLRDYVGNEFYKLEKSLAEPNQFAFVATSYKAPQKIRDGMIVLADGTKWNPGSGAGFYGYYGGSWKKLG